jgi:phosphatidylglycerol:prolipoprotein diacylglycerol transferase
MISKIFSLSFKRQFIELTLFGKSLQIKWYGISYLVGYLLIRYRDKKILERLEIQCNSQILEKVLEASLLSGIVGGRLWHLINRYFHYGIPIWFEAFQIWKGGMAFQGGLFLGFVGGVSYLFISGHKKELPKICDVALSQLPLGIAIGRLGNFMNEEFMYPVPIGEHLVDLIPYLSSISYLEEFQIPLCLFAALTEGLSLFMLTNYCINRKYVPYQTTWIFFFGYGCMRLLNDYFRDELNVGVFKLSEYICFGLILISSIALLVNIFSNKICTMQKKR